MAGKKKIFPRESGKYPGKGGKKPRKKTWTIVLGTVVGRYVGLVQSTIQNMSQLTIGVNLVQVEIGTVQDKFRTVQVEIGTVQDANSTKSGEILGQYKVISLSFTR